MMMGFPQNGLQKKDYVELIVLQQLRNATDHKNINNTIAGHK